MGIFVLLAWAVTASAGTAALVVWLRRRRRGSAFPARLLVVHVVAAWISLGLWLAHLVTDRTAWAWLAFAGVNVANVLGDTILTGRFRAMSGVVSSWWKDYLRALGAVLRGTHPPAATVHGLLAGVTYFSTLVACVLRS